jgi:Prokaryotic N-terminal methylation motif
VKIQAPAFLRRPRAAFTLIEMVIAVGLGTILLTVVAGLGVYGARTFLSMGNYIDLDDQSRNAVDTIGREIRDASAVLAFQTNLPTRILTLTNATAGVTVKFIYDSKNRTLVFQKTGQPEQTLLTQCDQWNFALYDRAPVATNLLSFHAATNGVGQLDPSFCKLINMTWNCSRTVIGAKLTTESVQTAQIVLRNKVK